MKLYVILVRNQKYSCSRQFASVFTNENAKNLPTFGTNPTPTISDIVISVKGVENQLISLNPQKASGPNSIPPWYWIEHATQIAPILTDIYQNSISNGVVPVKWKEDNVCAVFKKGKKI